MAQSSITGERGTRFAPIAVSVAGQSAQKIKAGTIAMRTDTDQLPLLLELDGDISSLLCGSSRPSSMKIFVCLASSSTLNFEPPDFPSKHPCRKTIVTSRLALGSCKTLLQVKILPYGGFAVWVAADAVQQEAMAAYRTYISSCLHCFILMICQSEQTCRSIAATNAP